MILSISPMVFNIFDYPIIGLSVYRKIYKSAAIKIVNVMSDRKIGEAISAALGYITAFLIAIILLPLVMLVVITIVKAVFTLLYRMP